MLWNAWRPVENAWLIVLNLWLWGLLGLVCAWGVRRRAKLGREFDPAGKKDTRSPVLYLREFGDERRPFLMQWSSHANSAKRTGRIVIAMARLASFPGMSRYTPLSFERFMTAAVEALLGPLIALGCPEDYMVPQGAARAYAPDDDWREWFARLASSAQAIVLSPGSSDSLRWELECILNRGMASKLFVALGPNAFELPPGRPDVSALLWAGRFAGFAEWRPVNWPRFQQTMAEIGYDVPLQQPCPPCVIAFGYRAQAVILPGRFETSHGYVAAIKGYLNRNPRSRGSGSAI
jgi:hypothetical protein